MGQNSKNVVTFDASAKLTQFMMKSVGLPLDAFEVELQNKGWWKISQGLLFVTSYMVLFLSVLGKFNRKVSSFLA